MLWTFNYKVGPEQRQGCVEARDEATAYRVMEWLSKQDGWRVYGQPRPMILADESVLAAKDEKKPADKIPA